MSQRANNGQRLCLCRQGQHAAFIPKKDDSFSGDLPGEFALLIEARHDGTGFRVAIQKPASFNEAQDTANVIVECLLAHPARIHSLDEFASEMTGGTWHFQVQTMIGRILSRMRRTPVRNYHTIETPFVFQDTVQQFVVFTGESAVYLVVGAHDGPRLCLADDRFKSREVDFTHGSDADIRASPHPLMFLIIRSKVLQ